MLFFSPNGGIFNLLENSQFGTFFNDLSNKPGSSICDVIVVKPEDTNTKITVSVCVFNKIIINS